MNYSFPFNIYDTVSIPDIETTGKVTEIQIIGHNVYYKIEYWFNGDRKSVYLDSSEIEKL